MHEITLQSIGDSCYFGGSALQCLLDQLVAAAGGEALFGLLAGSVIFVGFYIASDGDLATPTVALVLTGTVFVGMVPGSYGTIAAGVVAIGLAAAIWQVLQQYVMNPSTQR
jgi:hypothetical protein